MSPDDTGQSRSIGVNVISTVQVPEQHLNRDMTDGKIRANILKHGVFESNEELAESISVIRERVPDTDYDDEREIRTDGGTSTDETELDMPHNCIMCEQEEATKTVEEIIRGEVREFSVCAACETEIKDKRSENANTDSDDDRQIRTDGGTSSSDTEQCIECGDAVGNNPFYANSGLVAGAFDDVEDGESVPVKDVFGFNDGPYCSLDCSLDTETEPEGSK
ncbi:hypothetical protein [Natronorubrum daqingense]|uniref:Uncharacterized protein n=1 Tax=Natronorubrum daqingense TaxID=588898 RepID=A0A1N7G4T1_9EURY|nr:hypothetical protein [Natronorubrum daqingense]APX98732.1 hypothetical protein BB347_18680 [Natronorubrum daqingense]SIS07571.1 hypothetical protein SAMN05421809_3722 [Natronorubrum daqingense]